MMNRRTAVLVLFLLTLLAAAATCVPENYASGVPGYEGAYSERASYALRSGGSTPADTLRLRVQNSANPPDSTASAEVEGASYFDIITEASDGTAVRYGCVDSQQPTTVFFDVNGGYSGRRVEDDTGAQPRFAMFLGFNIAELQGYPGILSAKLHVPVFRFASVNLTTGYMAARVDTVPGDYNMLNSIAASTTNADSSFLEMTWNEVDVTNGTAWSPTLNSRDDAHDFGPRSEKLAPLASVVADAFLTLDLTAAMNHYMAFPAHDSWVIFYVYLVGTPAANNAFGYGKDPTKALIGSPALDIVATNSAPTPAWQDNTVPVSLVWDDNTNDDPSIYALMRSAYGREFSTASYRDSWDTTADSLYSANGGAGFDFLVHSKTHTLLGTLTGSALDSELSRDWMVGITGFDAADTLGLKHFAWVGGGSPKYSFEAVGRLIANGYETCRATTYTELTEIGDLSYPAWDMFVNLYAIQSQLGGLTGSTQADVTDEVLDYVDEVWTDHYRSAALFYNHGYTNGASALSLIYFNTLINESDFLTYRPHRWVADMLASRPLVAAADVTVGNGATAGIAASAARYDSVKVADGVGWPDSVWVGAVE